jgi:hypothetical protein
MCNLDANGLQQNAYFRVTQDFTAWAHDGFGDTNYHYGASQVCRARYVELPMRAADDLRPADEIHWLFGGMFLVGCGDSGKLKSFSGRVIAPDPDKSPFERTYGDPDAEKRGRIKQLIDEGKLVPITEAECLPIKQYGVNK